MYNIRLYKIFDTDYYAEYKCEVCKQSPAIKLIADCHGDSLCFCKEHWQDWFDNELMTCFDTDIGLPFSFCGTTHYYEKVEGNPEKCNGLGQIYQLKRSKE